MSQTLNQYLLRVGVFLALVFIIVVLLYPVLQEAFLSNIFINLIILLALAVGIIFNIVKLIDLNSDFSSLVNFDINKSSQSFTNNSGNLKNIIEDLKPIDGLLQSTILFTSSMILSFETIDILSAFFFIELNESESIAKPS